MLYPTTVLVMFPVWEWGYSSFSNRLAYKAIWFSTKIDFFFVNFKVQVAQSIVWGSNQANSNCSLLWMALLRPQCQGLFLHTLYASTGLKFIQTTTCAWKPQYKPSLCVLDCVCVLVTKPLVVWWIPWPSARLWPDNFLRFIIVIFNSVVLLYILMWVLLM